MNDPVNGDGLDSIVKDLDSYLEVDTKRSAALQIFGKTEKASQRIARQNAAEMTDDIAFVVILGRLEQDNGQAFAWSSH